MNPDHLRRKQLLIRSAVDSCYIAYIYVCNATVRADHRIASHLFSSLRFLITLSADSEEYIELLIRALQQVLPDSLRMDEMVRELVEEAREGFQQKASGTYDNVLLCLLGAYLCSDRVTIAAGLHVLYL